MAVALRSYVGRNTFVDLRNVGVISRQLNASFSTDSKKGFFSQLYDKYSIQGQRRRIDMGEHLFHAARQRSFDPTWYGIGRIGREFRPRHAMLTMHIWFLHKRLISDKEDPTFSLLIQEELFDILWHDTKSRIRAEGVNELTVNKHLKDVQQYTFQHLCHYDHCYTELLDKPKDRFETIGGLVWRHILLEDEEAHDDLIQRLAHYIEFQYNNICIELPDNYFREGRIAWGNLPDFSGMKDNAGKTLIENPVHEDDALPHGWLQNLTDSGETYYWKPETMVSQWKRPV